MKKLTLFLIFVISYSGVIGQSYYLSSSSGNDANAGSMAAPWKTLAKISSINLQPGSTVYFKRGDRFDGQFVVNGSGTASQPITITAYGTGEAPIITGEVGSAGGGDYEEAILVNNEDNMVFDGLEIQNERLVARAGVNDTDAYGILVLNNGNQVMENFVFQNMTFKNVYAVEPILDQSSFDAIQVSGLAFRCAKNNNIGSEKNIKNIEIKNSYFGNLQRFGIQFKHNGGADGVGDDMINRIMDVHVHHNEFSYNGGTGVLPNGTYNCLIEYNLFDHPGASTDTRMPGRGSSIWNIKSINTIMQYNVCLSTRGYLDSHGIHIDNFNTSTFVQYNYMEDCEGGFVEILRGNEDAVYRFNVSLNDGFRVNPTWTTSNHTIWVNAVRHKPETFDLSDGVYVYNNTVVINKAFTNKDFTSITMDGANTYVYNNIFSSTGAGSPEIGGHTSIQKAAGTSYVIRNNLFEGNVSSEFTTEDTNPRFGSPDFVGTGDQKEAFKLTEGSLAIDNGVAISGPAIPGAGTGVFADIEAYPTVDFYGNPIDLFSGTPNIGAHNAKFDALSVDEKNAYNFLVYPQPGKSKLHIRTNLNGVETLEVSLINIRGQEIMNQTKNMFGEQEIQLNLDENLPNGIYVLKINADGISHSRKIVLYH